MKSPDDPQIPGLIAKLKAYLKEIEQNEEQRRRTLEERIANMAQAAEDLLRAECDEQLAAINSTKSQQLEKLDSKISQIIRDHEEAKDRDANLIDLLATGVAEDIRDRRKHRSAGRLPRLTYEQLQEEQAYADRVACQVKDALRPGTEAREERFREEYEKLQGEYQEIAVRAQVQRQKILDETASKRKSGLEQHERLAAQLRSEEPSVLKKHMDFVHGLETILLGDAEDQGKREQEEQGARDESARREQEREQRRQGSEGKARKEKDGGEERKGREETEAKDRGRRSQSSSTRSTHSESTGEDNATRGIKHAWRLYASFAGRFEKRRDHPLTFADITWPVYPPISDISTITHTDIAQFLFSPHHSMGLPREERLRVALFRWHPDKFEAQWMGRIAERDKKRVKEAVEAIIRELLRLKADGSIWPQYGRREGPSRKSFLNPNI